MRFEEETYFAPSRWCSLVTASGTLELKNESRNVLYIGEITEKP